MQIYHQIIDRALDEAKGNAKGVWYLFKDYVNTEEIMIIKNLKIEKMANKGHGLGFADSIPIFVSRAIPGEIVDVEITESRKNIRFATTIKIIAPSPSRQNARCENFENCGGCDWLHIDYPAQLIYKDQVLDELFRKISVPITEPIDPAPRPRHYRNKIFYPVGLAGKRIKIGMFERKSHKVISQSTCNLHPKRFDGIIETIKDYLRAAKVAVYDEKSGMGNICHIGLRLAQSSGDYLVILVTKKRKMPFTNQLIRALNEKHPGLKGVIQNINPDITNVILGKDEKVLFGDDFIWDEMCGCKFKLNYRSFFQVNKDVAEKMYNFAGEHIEAGCRLLDAYCGVGTIGISLAAKTSFLLGLESNDAAVADARENALANGVTDSIFKCTDIEHNLGEYCKKHQIDTIIFDPPRKGLNKPVIEAIPAEVRNIVYISCDPATQVRDAAYLVDSGFKIVKRKGFDMFPQTYHIENVLILERT